MHTATTRLPYSDALSIYHQLKGQGPSCLFESASVVDKSSRLSVIGFEPTLELIGKEDQLEIRLLNTRAQVFFQFIMTEFAEYLEKNETKYLRLCIPKASFEGPEEERIERINIVQPIRKLLSHFKTDDKNYMGFYGALAYQFVYLFEDLPFQKNCQEPDFHLFLFDNILLFNHLTQDLTLYITRENAELANLHLEAFRQKTNTHPWRAAYSSEGATEPGGSLRIGRFSATPDDETFQKQVEQGIDLCNKGELLEIVLSRQLSAPVQGNLLALYERYKKINPSPYLFYFDFGTETLLGASPEMMLRYENGRATLRPISGSIRRSDDPIEDHQLMMQLLNDPKENSELDMLIDLGRNDLARICTPGIEIEHYRIVEKYAHITHTVSQISGALQARYSGFDALIASLNAGTLTGAPKIAAMRYIEAIEQHTRGYYGGTIGWMLLNGDVNTAITIRTAHIRDEQLTFSAGATLLYESVPENEWRETQTKAAAFMAAVEVFLVE